MKKLVSIILFLVSGVILFWYSSYTKQWPFNYQIAQFVGYLMYWSISLFVVSLFAFVLDNTKYKIWLVVTFVYVLLSVFVARWVGSGSDAIISFDGKDLTWFLSGLYSFVAIVYFIILFIKNKKHSTLVK